MFTFTILMTIVAFAILLAICYIGALGGAGIVLLADVIVCILGALGGAGIVLLADVIVCIWIVFKIFGHKSK